MRIKIGDKHVTKLKDVSKRKAVILPNPTLPRNRVDVNAMRSGQGEDYLEIKVYSTHGDGWLAAKATIRPSRFRTAKELLYAMELAGAAGAEHLAEAYGDTLDASTCAKYAKELGIEALRKINDGYVKAAQQEEPDFTPNSKPRGHHDNKIIITP